ncbi:site-specific integrase [Streptomyces antarcticus]|uniref:site-specific integrase n=1 Tax=Streptomyces antarcticus TaxID=2996458 RepID=UPI003B82D7B0
MDLALYELALRTGLRKGVLLGLHWEDLDLGAGTATVRRSLQRTRTGGLTHLPTNTRASERRIALPTECLHWIKEYRERQDTECETAGSGWRDSGLVFTTPTGRPLDPANLTRRFRRFLGRAGLRRIRFHDLRHSTATLLLEQGVDLVVIKELLGRTHIGVTAASPPTSDSASSAKPTTPWASPRHIRRRPRRSALDGSRPLTLPSIRQEAPPESNRRGLLLSRDSTI